MKKYKHLFFDLDHTLWDFERCSSETLSELYFKHGFNELRPFTSQEQFYLAFRRINFSLWGLYNRGEVTKAEIRDNRFKMIFEAVGWPGKHLPPGIGHEYLYTCPAKPHLLPRTRELLEYLQNRYTMHILTNGFEDVQGLKLRSSGIDGFFATVTTSECTGFKKPKREIFEHALQKAGAKVEDSLMVGDNLETDIAGAESINMDCVLYNPERLDTKGNTCQQVHCHSELKKML